MCNAQVSPALQLDSHEVGISNGRAMVVRSGHLASSSRPLGSPAWHAAVDAQRLRASGHRLPEEEL